MPSKELVVSQTRHETKVAVLEDGQLVEVHFQRANEYSLAGSIHKGRVTRVLPGMQSAFVDLGLERDTFLYVSDFFDEHGDEVEKVESTPAPGNGGGRGRERGRGRGRGRDRERSRETREGAPSVVEARPAAVEEPAEEPAAQAQPAGEDGGESRRDRRGRRSRRRRGQDRGFPEAKYASPADTLEASEEEQPESDDSGPEETGDSGLPEVILLPGESLAKYRKAAQTADEEGQEDEGGDDPSGPEDEADEAIEQLLDRVDELEQEEILARPDSGPVVIESEPAGEPGEAEDEASPFEDVSEDDEEDSAENGPASGEAEEDEAGEEDDEDDPAVSEARGEPAVDDTSRKTAGEADAEEEQPGPEEPADGIAQAAAEEDGVEPARIPQSLTATLRAKGERAGHRVSRRRRRGRGAEATPESAAQEESGVPEEVAPEAAEAVQAEPARPPRGERRERGERSEQPERDRRERPPLPSISELLREGQEIIVQIAKEPLGQKGARITSHIALPGRYVVYMPTVEHFGVSRKISTEEERQRLKRILQKYQEGVPGGYIMRTAGEGRSEDDIASDMKYLAGLWQEIKTKADKRRAPALLHHDVQIVERLLRDQLTDGFKAVWVDSEDLYEQVLHSMERLAPALLNRVKLYTRSEPIFEAFGVTQELEKAIRPKVWLKSGGYIVINQTEALVAIDINTGKYVGKSNRLEDTIVKTNLEAVKEIVRQMRLRDLGGIIVVDFIDMDERKNRQKVMQALEEAMKADKAPYKILQFNDFGLVAITRKRVKQSLERTLCSPCPYCEGAGYVKSVEAIISEILIEAQKYAKVVDGKDCLLRVNPEVAKVLKSVQNKYLEELEEILGRPVLVSADALLHQEKFDLT